MQTTIADGKGPVRFPARMAFRVPRDLPRAVELAAERDNTGPAEWTRRVILKALEADGIRIRAGMMEAQP